MKAPEQEELHGGPPLASANTPETAPDRKEGGRSGSMGEKTAQDASDRCLRCGVTSAHGFSSVQGWICVHCGKCGCSGLFVAETMAAIRKAGLAWWSP